MASFNKVLLMGNLTKDPELRYTPQGTAVVNLRMAVNRRWKDKAGEQKEEVCYVTVVVWDKQAEICNQYLKKGSSLFVEGRLQSRSWEDSAGQKRNVMEVRCERVQFLGRPQSTAAMASVQESRLESPAAGVSDTQEEDVSWMEGEEKSE